MSVSRLDVWCYPFNKSKLLETNTFLLQHNKYQYYIMKHFSRYFSPRCHSSPTDAHCCHTGTAAKYSVPDRVKPSFVIFGTLMLSRERQSARMSKNTGDGLTRSGTGCATAVLIWQQWVSKVEMNFVATRLDELSRQP